MEKESIPWWGSFTIPEGCSGLWTIGPFLLRASWCPPEWRLIHHRRDELQEDTVEIVCPEEPDPQKADPLEGGELSRILPPTSSNHLDVLPKLADRPIVVRPETAVQLLSGAKITLYVSSSLWVAVQVGEPQQQVLDVPTWLMSDTWFGPTTIEGELCYAIKTSARLHLENLPHFRHRAITRVLLENRTAENLNLERLNLPVPNLSLYCDAEGHFWTQAVTVKLQGVDKMAEVDLGKGPPAEAREPVLVSGPRTPAQLNILMRAKNALFF